MEQMIIPIIENGNVKAVDARDLHAFLEVGKVFGTWITDRIKKYCFVENEDYQTRFPNLGSELHGGQNRAEYIISIDMAKELSMVENNEKGRQARKYFIEVEKSFLQAALGAVQNDQTKKELDEVKDKYIAALEALCGPKIKKARKASVVDDEVVVVDKTKNGFAKFFASETVVDKSDRGFIISIDLNNRFKRLVSPAKSDWQDFKIYLELAHKVKMKRVTVSNKYGQSRRYTFVGVRANFVIDDYDDTLVLTKIKNDSLPLIPGL